MPAVFISYRREDAAASAGRLRDELVSHFGEENVFMDVDGIRPGQNFVNVIRERVAECGVLIAVIGRGWLNCSSEAGGRRIDSPGDFVRLEVAAALERGIPVIPALVDGSAMPGAQELPRPLAALSEIQAQQISHRRFHQDTGELIQTVASILPSLPVRQPVRSENSLYAEMKRSLTAWISVLAAPRKTLGGLNLEDAGTLLFAWRFMFYMIAIEMIITVARGLASGRVGDLVPLAVALNLQYLSAAFILHAAMAAFGGKATLQSSVAAYCFMAAYIPVIDVVQNPALDVAMCVFRQPDPLRAFQGIAVDKLSGWTIFQLVLSFASATAAWCRYFWGLFGAYRTTHRLSVGKTRLSFVLGLAAYVVFTVAFCAPFLRNTYRKIDCPADIGQVFALPRL